VSPNEADSGRLRDPYEAAKVVVLFRSQLHADAGGDYTAMADAMLERARGFPGFVAIRDYASPAGERLAVVWWESHETLAAWREDTEHLAAQRLGRERWFEWFRLEVCDRVRTHGFDRSR